MSDDMDLPGYARLLRDAARASALSWAEPIDRHEHDRAVRQLSIAVREMRTLLARLAIRFRFRVIIQPGPARSARAAAVLASVQALGQVWLFPQDILPSQPVPAYDACVPADLLCFAARRAATWPMPVIGLDEIAQPLADALEALDEGTAHLAAVAAQPLAACLDAVRACLQAASNQLRNSLSSGVPGSDSARTPTRTPVVHPCLRAIPRSPRLGLLARSATGDHVSGQSCCTREQERDQGGCAG